MAKPTQTEESTPTTPIVVRPFPMIVPAAPSRSSRNNEAINLAPTNLMSLFDDCEEDLLFDQ